ncbi:SDR family NAD(P)-dependent oxidoreductase (plasmid) [Rhodobacteraceae bacterium SC52]|nr:SDR family NAD(P)-dependent oxidoreductase [Rhodobacteraceae bacterium SC52]
MRLETLPDLQTMIDEARPEFQCLVALPAGHTAPISAALVAQGHVVLDASDGIPALSRAVALADSVDARSRMSIAIDAGLHGLRGAIVAALPGVGLVLRCQTVSDLDAISSVDKDTPVLVESGSLDVLAKAAHTPGVVGLIAVGEEAGGWCGPDAGLILAQRMARLAKGSPNPVPWFIRAATGPDSAAAYALAGAAGVMLSDELLLLAELGTNPRLARAIETANGTEAVLLGAQLGAPFRLFLHPTQPAARALEAAALDIEASSQNAETARQRWIAQVDAAREHGGLHPMGQGIGLAKKLRDQFSRIGPVIAAYRGAAGAVRARADVLAGAIGPGAPLAVEHGCALPIVQGPMTRVSDGASFAAAVAEAGALPMLALAALRPEEISTLLKNAQSSLADRPWGVGMLGFLPPEQFKLQLDEVLRAAPPFAILAGGRADQVQRLEAEGIRTYAHAPTAELAKLLIDGGVRRLILEGRECGGHVGPLHSLNLWESVANTLAGHPKVGEVSVLLAGGIHDGLSAGMAVTAAAPLLNAGAKLGVLMGTAYLSTEELCASGGIGPYFQSALVKATGTATIESGRGHANRCLQTPFVDTFHSERRALLSAGTHADPMREALDDLLLGRLRLASKGLKRADEGLVSVPPEEQQADGMFMAGEAASLITSVQTVEELHRNVSEGAVDILRDIAGHAEPALTGDEAINARAAACDVAIIGLAVHVPGATDAQGFWRNILDKRNSISEIPKDRWDHRIYHSDAAEDDAVTSHFGGFMDGMLFDPLRFGIPPKSVPHIAPGQLLTLETVRRAFADAGYADREFDRENSSVIIGGEDAGGFLGNALTTRALAPLLTDADAVREIRSRTPSWTEETFPGVLTSVVAGRIANRFDLGGANYTIDSACASSITALALATDELTSGRSNLVVLAGVDTTQTPYHYTAFSSVTALSRRGRLSAFDQSADGTVLSEGVAAFILKRREDAERDGDRIYATIKAVASSSDGRGMGMTAPRPLGQKRALRRAYRALGGTMADIDYYEAHGTGTPVGDAAELDSVATLMAEAGVEGESCALGSVKALIGHTKTAAGAVGLAKVALSIYHRTLPPQPGIEHPVGALGQSDFPLYVTDGPTPWLASDRPRRAGISAFGFGGTNAHAVLEEHPAFGVQAPGADRWPAHFVALTARSQQDLERKWSLVHALAVQEQGGPSLESIASAAAAECDPDGQLRSAIIAESRGDLAQQVQCLLDHFQNPEVKLGDTIWLGAASAAPPIAFLLPGQGSQRVQMCREAAVYLPEMRTSLAAADTAARQATGARLGRIIYPPSAFDAETKTAQAALLTEPQNAQIALGGICAGMVDFLGRIGVRPDMTAGHSYGELVALYAAGAISRGDLLSLSAARGSAMAQAAPGGMCAVAAPVAQVTKVLAHHADVVIANLNAPDQTVISGAKAAVEAAAKALEHAGCAARMLPVGGAFHSPLMVDAAAKFAGAFDAVALNEPNCPVISARGGKPFPQTPDGIAQQLIAQICEPVDWIAQVEALYDAGARTFVEVGPTGVLSHLTGKLLKGRGGTQDGALSNVEIVSMDDGRGLRGMLVALARLWAKGYDIDFAELAPRLGVSLAVLTQSAATAVPKSAWLVDGMHIRPAHSEAAARPGGYELRTIDTVPVPRQEPATPRSETTPSDTKGALMNSANEDGLLTAYSEYQATMRQFLQTQEQVMNLLLTGAPGETVVNAPVSALPVAAPPLPEPVPVPAAAKVETAPAPPPATAAPSEVASAPLDRAGVAASLLKIVADHTGYPDDMIAFDLDVEAEFGIESIKRLEILERFIGTLPPHAVDAFRSDAERVARERVLDIWVDAAMSAISTGEGARPFDQGASAAEADNTATTTAPHNADCPLYVMAPRACPLPETVGKTDLGPLIVLRGPEELTAAVVEKLTSTGTEHRVLDPVPDALPEAIADARDALGPIRGLIHLAGCVQSADWSTAMAEGTTALYRAISAALPDLTSTAETPARIFALTRLGGLGGRTAMEGLPPANLACCAAGGVQGLLNSVTLEHPQIAVRAIDLAASIPDVEAAGILLREMSFLTGRVEVGYTSAGRVVLDVVECERQTDSEHEPALGKDTVVVATGGVRGVTVAALKAIAAPGARIIALSRRAEPEAEDPAYADASDANALRRVLIEAARARGEMPRPPEVETRIERILRDRAARAGLNDLRAHGFTVDVRAVDLGNRAAVTEAMDQIHTVHARIDGLVHGAGVIEDKLIAQKAPASFDRVLGTKTAALDILLTHPAAAGYSHVLFFSSIAGRLGNRGQSDYGAANEVLNRAALWLKSTRPDVTVASINWGPWAGAGMASEAVNAQFRARGIEAIPLQAGAATANWALTTESAPVELIAGRGNWMENLGAECPVDRT